MKYLTLVIITLLFTACSHKSPSISKEFKTDTVENLARTSLKTFRDNDKKAFIAFIAPDKNDMEAMLRYSMQKEVNAIKNPATKKAFIQKMEKEIATVSKGFQKEHGAITKNIMIQWSDIQNSGLQHGLKWADTIYAGHTFEAKNIYDVSGLKRGDVLVKFSDMKNRYTYKLRDCVKMPYGNYRCVGIKELRK